MAIGELTHNMKTLERDSSLEHLLLGDLLDLLDDSDRPETRVWLLKVIDMLLQVLPREFRSEERGGYLEEVLDEFPSWDRQVRDLLQQHVFLQNQLRRLRKDIATADQRISLKHRFALYEWVEQVNDHNERETALLQTALNLDVGVGD